MLGVGSARAVRKTGGERMPSETALLRKSVRAPPSQGRNLSALLRPWSLFLLGGQVMTSLGQDGSKLATVCCQSGVADLSVVPSGHL